MKPRTLIKLTLAILIAGSALVVLLPAQDSQSEKPKHHHYKLVDLGTLGGPRSYVNPGSGNETGNYASVLDNRGTVAGFADTLEPDPFPSSCFLDDCFVSHTFEWKDGVKTDLGALPGGASSASNWISENRLIVGLSQDGKIDPLVPGMPEVHAVLWRNGAITDLGTLPEGGFESIASAVNNRGQVVGLAINTIADPNSMVGIGFQTRAFLWQDGTMQDLGTLGNGTDAQAILINERGQVVGWSYINSVPTNACNPGFAFVTGSFIWDKENGLRDLGNLGGTCTTASDMNNRGQVVGFSNLPGDQSAHGFLWDNGAFQDLGGSLGGKFQGPFAVNERGEAVGFATLPGDNVFHAVIWKHVGDLYDLGVVGADQCSFASSINAKTQVVGASGDCVSTSRVVLWEDGAMFDLNALIPPNSALFLEAPQTINDRGEIAGTGADMNGNEHAFLAIPCDDAHPNIEGCDYGLVEESAPPAAQDRTSEGPKIDLLENGRKLFQRRPAFSRFVKSAQNAASISTALTSAPSAALSPTSLTFSTQAIGTTSAAKTVTLKNTSTTTLMISGIAITGANIGDFAQTHTCGSSLAAGASCSISVTFKPTASGMRTAALSVSDNAAGSPQQVSLGGIGTTAKLSPASLNFGTVAIGTTSAARNVALTNVGTTTLTITGITITGSNAGDFAQTHTCGSSLATGASCFIIVTFRPTASGMRTAALSLSDNGAGSPQAISLSGIGTTAKFSPTSLNFGIVVVGATSAPKAVMLTNIGTSPLTVNSIAITGPDSGDFSQTHTCGSSLAAGASCTISVTFKPKASGGRAAELSISDNADGSPQMVPLTGGVLTCIPFGGFCFGPGPNHCCPAPYPHHSFCSDPTGWGTCIES